MMLRCLLILAALLASACTAEPEGRAEIHYFGIGYETLVPVTTDNIVEQHLLYGNVEVSDPRFQEMMGLIDGAGPGSFDRFYVRARIRDSNGVTLYIANDGGIQMPGREAALDETSLGRVAELLSLMTAPRQAKCSVGRAVEIMKAGHRDWAIQAAHDHVKKTENWPRSDYNIRFYGSSIRDDCLLLLEVNHRDDANVYNPETGVLTAGGGKSFRLYFDPNTRALVRTIGYQ